MKKYKQFEVVKNKDGQLILSKIGTAGLFNNGGLSRFFFHVDPTHILSKYAKKNKINSKAAQGDG